MEPNELTIEIEQLEAKIAPAHVSHHAFAPSGGSVMPLDDSDPVIIVEG